MECVLFDFGGTLDSDGTSWGNRFYPLYKEAGLAITREQFDRAFYASDDNLATRFNLKGLNLEDTLHLQVRCVLESVAPDRLDLTEKIAGRFLEDCRSHFRRNRPVLERLAARYRLGIVSNWYGNLEDILRGEGLRELFGAVADSSVVGCIKPEPKIFRHAADALGSPVEECLMVGDSVPRDMRGAEGLKMAHALIGASAACCGEAWQLSIFPDLEAKLQ